MATISESLTLRLERLRIKTISTLLEHAEPLLTTASELLLSTLAWSETYLWYLEISLDELESRLAKEEPVDIQPEGDLVPKLILEQLYGIDWAKIILDQNQS
jgi:hypothetical protein